VLKGYKIHQEQIENVARTLRESTQTRHPKSLPAGCAGKKKPILINRITGSTVHSPRTTVWETGAKKGLLTNVQTDSFPGTIAPGHTGPVMWCRRCGEGFPVLDFLYTKKTGLCISCWEAKVV
jgi:hypothetical protein